MPITTEPESTQRADDARRNFMELARGFGHAMLVTQTAERRMHARPMHIVRVDDDGDLWFVTSVDSAKIEELTRTSSVLVTMQAQHRFASVNGVARIVRDPAKTAELWSDSFRLYWKNAADPSIAVIHLLADSAEYWDDSGTAGIKWAFRATAAMLKGTTMQGDDDDVDLHGRVKL